MADPSDDSGGAFLSKKSQLQIDQGQQPKLEHVLVIDDEAIDADRMRATLRVLFGYATDVAHAATVDQAIDCVLERTPTLVLLDDILKPSDDALQSMPLLRRAGYDGPIIVISGQVTRQRQGALKAAGAAEVIHKDDVNSVRLAEAIVKTLQSKQ